MEKRPPKFPPPAPAPIHSLQYQDRNRDQKIANEVARRWRRLRIKRIIDIAGTAFCVILIVVFYIIFRYPRTLARLLY